MTVIRYLSKLIFPERCIFCGKPTKLHSGNPYLCESCAENMPYLRPNGEIDENSAVRGVSVFRYEAVKDTIFKFKYDGYKNYGKILGKYMADYVIENNICDVLEADIIVPIPLWKKKEKERGFNQSALLAEAVSDIIGIPFENEVLIRNRKTVPQKGLSRSKRSDNLRGAFSLGKGSSVENKKVVIVDDIYTTGSTVYECSKILYGAGADKVFYLALSAPGTDIFEVEYTDKDVIKGFDE